MKECASIIRALTRLLETESDGAFLGSPESARRAVLAQLATDNVSGKLLAVTTELVDAIIEQRHKSSSHSRTNSPEQTFKLFLNGSDPVEHTPKELREFFHRKGLEKVDICMLSGCNVVLLNGKRSVGFQGIKKVNYQVLAYLLKNSRRWIPYEEIHDAIGSPYNRVSPGKMHSAIYDYLIRLQEKLKEPPPKCQGKWFQIQNSSVQLNETLQTAFIEPTDSSQKALKWESVLPGIVPSTLRFAPSQTPSLVKSSN